MCYYYIGAMDDGAAVLFAFEAVRAIANLGLRAKRTIRFVAWTGEEINMCGIKGYIAAHNEEIKNKKIVMAFESDYGAFQPYAVGVKGAIFIFFIFFKQFLVHL